MLNLSFCIISDAGTVALVNKCHGLADVSFGSGGTHVPCHTAPFRPDDLPNYGFDKLLMACIRTLRHFLAEINGFVVPGDVPISSK